MNIKKIISCIVLGAYILTFSPLFYSNAAAMPDSGTEPLRTHYVSPSRGITLTRDEFFLLAKLIHAEARGETLEGQIAVGAVVLNRLGDPRFPKTITKVIYEKNQFSPVMDGNINLPPSRESLLAAEMALNGIDPTNGCLFFYNPEKAQCRWPERLPVSIRIGNHLFCLK